MKPYACLCGRSFDAYNEEQKRHIRTCPTRKRANRPVPDSFKERGETWETTKRPVALGSETVNFFDRRRRVSQQDYLREIRRVAESPKTNASALRLRLGTLGDLRIPYGIAHGPIVAYAEERLRELHWPRTMHTLRGCMLRNDMDEAHERLKGTR